MSIQTPVKQETKKIAVGVAILCALMVLVFALIGYYDQTVLWGTLLGGGFAVFNFFLMALTVQHAAEQMNGVRLPDEEPAMETESEQATAPKEEVPQQKAARKIVQRSYLLRMALTAGVAVLSIKAPVFHAVPAIIALFFPRIVITIQPLWQKIRKGA